MNRTGIRRVTAFLAIAAGVLLCSEAVLAGPHAFSLGWKVVSVLVIAGIAFLIAGVLSLLQVHRSNKSD